MDKMKAFLKRFKKWIVACILFIIASCFFMQLYDAHGYTAGTQEKTFKIDSSGGAYFQIKGGPKGDSKVKIQFKKKSGATTYSNMLAKPSTWSASIASGTNNHSIRVESSTITTKKDVNGEYLILDVIVSYEMPAHYRFKSGIYDKPPNGRWNLEYYAQDASGNHSADWITGTGAHQGSNSRRTVHLNLNTGLCGLNTFSDKRWYYNCTIGFNIGKDDRTVTFVDGLGHTLKTQTVVDGAGATPPANPTRTGYTFAGWNGSYGAPICSNRTITAKWNINYYYLDINGLLDGTSAGNTSGYGTFDVYINGSLVANDVSDYYTSHPYGASYQISDIRASTGRIYNGVSSGAVSGTFNGAKSVQLKFTTNSYTLTINPNGGVWNGSSSTQSFNQKYGTSKSIAKPTRTGYIFGGWLFSGSGNMSGLATTDPTFKSSNGNIHVYNNAGGGTVTHSRVGKQADNTSGSSYEIKISTTGTASPGLGGFYQSMTSGANKKFIHTFVAKIPVGYTVSDYRNAIGDGGYSTWLTSKAGTGKWETYAYEVNCGASGQFSTFGHVALSGGNKTVTWYLAQSQITEVTSTNTFNYSAGNCTLTASWVPSHLTNSIYHWMFGFKNGEGNNGNKTAYNITNTTFNARIGETYIMDKSKGVAPPKGFYLCDTFGTSSITGSWATYNMGTSVTQKPNVMAFEYDYAPSTYKITYNLNGGTNHTSNPSTYNILYGVTLQNPTRPGWKFNGWELDGQKVTGINPGANATFTSESDMRNKLNSRTIGDVDITATWLPIPIINGPTLDNCDNNPIAPFISGNNLIIQQGDTFTPLKYVTATDPVEGESITSKVKVKSMTLPLDNGRANTTGTFTITYSVTNNSGVSTEKTITVIVNEPPKITGPNVRHKLIHEKIDNTFLLSQQSANDKEDSNITQKLGVKLIKDELGNVIDKAENIDTRYVSTYEITITVTDNYKKTVDKTYTLKIVKDDYKYEESHDTEFRFISKDFLDTINVDSKFHTSVDKTLNKILQDSLLNKKTPQKIVRFNNNDIQNLKNTMK